MKWLLIILTVIFIWLVGIEWAVVVILTTTAGYLAFYYFSGGEGWFQESIDNTIQFVYRGGDLKKILLKVDALKIVDRKIVPGEQRLHWIERFLGKRFLGFLPWDKIRSFPFFPRAEYVNNEETFTTTVKWTALEEGKNTSSFFHRVLFNFKYDYLEGGKGKGLQNFRANLKITGVFTVIDPILFYVSQSGGYGFREVYNTIGTFLANAVAQLQSYNEMKEQKRTSGPGGLFETLLAELRENLLKTLGVELLELNAPDLSTDPALEKSIAKKAVAFADGEARITASVADLAVTQNVAEAEKLLLGKKLEALGASTESGLVKAILLAADAYKKGGQ